MLGLTKNVPPSLYLWSSYDRIWFSGPEKQELLILILIFLRWILLPPTTGSSSPEQIMTLHCRISFSQPWRKSFREVMKFYEIFHETSWNTFHETFFSWKNIPSKFHERFHEISSNRVSWNFIKFGFDRAATLVPENTEETRSWKLSETLLIKGSLCITALYKCCYNYNFSF
jgi:hypothetical protein